MPGSPRGRIFDPRIKGAYHCYARCVRRSRLLGKDEYSKRSFEHRRTWVEDRIRHLAKWFAIDVCFQSIMGNHYHIVLRNRPELVDRWSDREVIRRSIKIFPSKFERLGVKNGDPTDQQLARFESDMEMIAELRLRLSHISWFMRQLNQFIARRANEEDDCTGHFFESRFKCKLLLDDTGVLICGIYVDLNQIRAGEASTPEDSNRTSAFRRIMGRLARIEGRPFASDWDAFLCPIDSRVQQTDDCAPPPGQFASARASDTGMFEMSLDDYLQIVDWAGRQVRSDKKGAIDANAPPILQRLSVNAESLVAFIEDYETLFPMAVGSAKSLQHFSNQLQQNHDRNR